MKFIINTEISTSSWAGCGREINQQYIADSLEGALDKLYATCKYESHNKRNHLNMFTDGWSNPNNIAIYYEQSQYAGTGSILEIIAVNDNDERVRIYDEGKYVSPKCLNILKSYEKKLDNISNSVQNGDF